MGRYGRLANSARAARDFQRRVLIAGGQLAEIGGDISQSVVYDGNPAYASTSVRGLDTIGGWSQLKFKLSNTIEFNAAAGC